MPAAAIKRNSELCSTLSLEGRASVAALPWGDAQVARKFIQTHGEFDLIIGSDLIWQEEAVPLLATTIDALLRSCKRPCELFLGYKHRYELFLFERLHESLELCMVDASSVLRDLLDHNEPLSLWRVRVAGTESPYLPVAVPCSTADFPSSGTYIEG